MNRENGKFPIKINFRSEQRNGADVEVSEFTAHGFLYRKGKFDYLQYEEVINEIGTVNTIIKIAKGEATILRKGSISMNQRFLTNEMTAGIYQSPYGPIEMETTTSNIVFDYDESENRGSFVLVYKMAIQQEPVGDYQIHIAFEGRTQ